VSLTTVTAVHVRAIKCNGPYAVAGCTPPRADVTCHPFLVQCARHKTLIRDARPSATAWPSLDVPDEVSVGNHHLVCHSTAYVRAASQASLLSHLPQGPAQNHNAGRRPQQSQAARASMYGSVVATAPAVVKPVALVDAYQHAARTAPMQHHGGSPCLLSLCAILCVVAKALALEAFDVLQLLGTFVLLVLLPRPGLTVPSA
jgi:hypothetical protein